ncbi:zinc ABC transporter ATP-binding protein ZnuC [Hyphomicrobium sp. CS1GBMeth3]|uniref:zinc ABC transporter ATP-binding protein ZnuC n=1 Tax=Hyphomicrobium sp. CS1GBMeth3 TaxID=1892845 RepID=UPI000931C3CE|nr:zinc ABC transporter ATP-binding protein ZnuC [Hyphomicrobium sp. CS1GBMeth3]
MSDRQAETEGSETTSAASAREHAATHAHTHDHSGTCCGHQHHPPPFDPKALIGARGLKVVRSGRTILSDIDIDIHAGEIVTLIGPNGAGKTTLVRTLLGLERPDGGSVRRRPGLKIGYVPQKFDIDRTLPMTVARFLALGDGARKDRIADVLKEVGAGHVASQQLGDLSGGELQRVVLARALLNDPDLLVLDEPVRGVDYVGEAELYGLIGRLRDSRGLGVLLISHDLHVVMAQSDRVICLNRHVCCSGVPETVSQHPEYVRLFGAEQARNFAVYQHHHDHRHDLAGDTATPSDSSATGGQK